MREYIIHTSVHICVFFSLSHTHTHTQPISVSHEREIIVDRMYSCIERVYTSVRT